MKNVKRLLPSCYGPFNIILVFSGISAQLACCTFFVNLQKYCLSKYWYRPRFDLCDDVVCIFLSRIGFRCGRCAASCCVLLTVRICFLLAGVHGHAHRGIHVAKPTVSSTCMSRARTQIYKDPVN